MLTSVTFLFQGGGKRQSGYVSELQEGPDSRIDALLLLFVDYASPAQAVGFCRHQSRRGCVFDWKNYCHVQFAVHRYITQLENLGSLRVLQISRATTERYCAAEALGNYPIRPNAAVGGWGGRPVKTQRVDDTAAPSGLN